MAHELRNRFVDVDGVKLHWAELGAPSDLPPVVLIHGLTDAHLTWRKVAEPLSRSRLVLMPDLPGCGLSGRPDASYGLEWQAQWIARWLQTIDANRVDVVGHSYGGGVAQMLLLACPERLRRIVLAASGGLGREVGFWLKFGTFPFFVEHFGQPFMAFGTRRALSRLIKPSANDNPNGQASADEQSQQDLKTLSEMNAMPGTARAFSRTVRDVINFGGQTRHFLQRAHEVSLFPPVLVLWGEQDTLIPMKHGEDFVAALNHATFKSFPDCGHYLHQENPAAFVAALHDFLDAPHAVAVTLRNA